MGYLMALKVNKHILNSIRAFIGRKWRSMHFGVILSRENLGMFTISLAAHCLILTGGDLNQYWRDHSIVNYRNQYVKELVNEQVVNGVFCRLVLIYEEFLSIHK